MQCRENAQSPGVGHDRVECHTEVIGRFAQRLERKLDVLCSPKLTPPARAGHLSDQRLTQGRNLMPNPLSPDDLKKIHAYWRAANYLSVGQIYLFENPLLR